MLQKFEEWILTCELGFTESAGNIVVKDTAHIKETEKAVKLMKATTTK